jgi:hypothetical protein
MLDFVLLGDILLLRSINLYLTSLGLFDSRASDFKDFSGVPIQGIPSEMFMFVL